MISKGVNVTGPNNGALVTASRFRQLKIVEYLISKGDDVTAKNNDSLYFATQNKDINMINYLIVNGATSPDEYTTRRIQELL